MKDFSPLFKFRTEPTTEIVDLLSSVSLGTNGTIYKHLNTAERLNEIDNPLYLSLERRERVLGNITFCRRDKDWYIRYFAFEFGQQSSNVRKEINGKKNSLLKSELETFFQDALDGKQEEHINSFYAYIDPRNDRSLRMAEEFGFMKCSTIATQTFSRIYPSKSTNLVTLSWDDAQRLVKQEYGFHKYYHTELTSKGPIYGLMQGSKIVALAKVTAASWEIQRLPGKLGPLLLRVLPKIPLIRKLFNPKQHEFLVPEAVYVKGDDPALLNELFEGILAECTKNTIIWWVDLHDPTYRKIKNKMRWGLLHRILGVNNVNLMVRSNVLKDPNDQTPTYVIGLDFV
jgi:hypothetical protein